MASCLPIDLDRACWPGVLLVDDNAGLREILRRGLRSEGFAVFAAGSAAEALRLADEHAGRIDALLLDLRLGGPSGPHLRALLQAACPGRPCLFMTGGADEVEGEEVLRRPFALGEAAAALRGLLGA